MKSTALERSRAAKWGWTAFLAAVLGGQTRVAAAGPELQLDPQALRETIRITVDGFSYPVLAPPYRRPIIRPHAGGSSVDGGGSIEEPEASSGFCALDPDEACVGGSGLRRLLRFDVLVHNRGDADMVLGNPYAHPELYMFSKCHGHYHFKDASTYELLDADGTVVVTGRKQGFCMMDSVPSEPGTTPVKRYDCNYQGISKGMADLYDANRDCQWVDITDVPPGRYALRVVWDPLEQLADGSRDDNEVVTPVVIPPPGDAPPRVLSIVAPQPGQRLSPGLPTRISWTASDDVGLGSEEVWLSLDGGATWKQLVGDVPPSRSYWNWNVPTDISSDDARIRVVARDKSAQRGELASGRFSIQRMPSPLRRVPG